MDSVTPLDCFPRRLGRARFCPSHGIVFSCLRPGLGLSSGPQPGPPFLRSSARTPGSSAGVRPAGGLDRPPGRRSDVGGPWPTGPGCAARHRAPGLAGAPRAWPVHKPVFPRKRRSRPRPANSTTLPQWRRRRKRKRAYGRPRLPNHRASRRSACPSGPDPLLRAVPPRAVHPSSGTPSNGCTLEPVAPSKLCTLERCTLGNGPAAAPDLRPPGNGNWQRSRRKAPAGNEIVPQS